jgi:uncharacterized protein (DUF885 family)
MTSATPDGGAMTTPPTADAAFRAFEEKFLADSLALDPTAATKAGEHAHDGKWPDVSNEGEASARAFYVQRLKDLDGFSPDALGLQNKVDLAILKNSLKYSIFAYDALRDYDWNPLAYTRLVADGLDPLLTRSFASLEERMASLRARLEGVPAIVAVAKKRLAHAPMVHTETAIEQNKGLIDLCKHEVTKVEIANGKTELDAAAAKAATSLEDFHTFLEKDLKKRSDGEFRLGKEKFEKKLGYELGDESLSSDAIVAGARALLASTQEEMVATAKELWPTLPALSKEKPPKSETAAEKKALVKKVLDALANDRPDDATIVARSKKLLAEASTFVRDHDLVTIPEQPCDVIEMPEYRRGVAVAYCESSGPLEKKQETFFAISPTPKDWPPKRVLSFYREYNDSMLAELTVHEAMPGHFLQIMHNNQFDSKLRAVLADGSFVEGWAVYAEWLMAKYGFGGAKVRMQRQKMVLRLCANAILDHEVHAGTMDEKAALALMMGEAFQEEGEAVGKWRRARLSSAQLTTYYYGFSEMLKLRESAEKQAGFSERAYHDKLIGSGSPPMKQLRVIMGAS